MRTRSLAVETERYPRSLSRNSLAAVSLAAAAFLFGATFVVVKDAVTVLPPLGFVGWRFLIGALVLLAVARPRTRAALTAGVIAGLWLFAGYAFQTKGLVTTLLPHVEYSRSVEQWSGQTLCRDELHL